MMRVVIAFYRIYRCMCFYTQLVSMCFNLFQFFFGKSTGVYNNAMYLVTFFFGQVFYTIGSIQSTAKTQNNFF